MDRAKFSKKEFPAQTKNRAQWILDTIRANQESVGWILWISGDPVAFKQTLEEIREELSKLHKQDRDALLLPNGILTDEQITALGFDTETESVEQIVTSAD